MDTTQAKSACEAYHDLIARYRNPAIAPELLEIMQDLYSAAAYFDRIPLDQLTLEQENIIDEIDKILMRD